MTASVERLTDRLARTPLVFRGPVVGMGAVRVDAVVADLFRDRATRPLERTETDKFLRGDESPIQVRHLEIVLLACWLLHDETFAGTAAEPLLALFDHRLRRLGDAVVPRLFVDDVERREELVRTCLAALGRLPDGESADVAEDRLAVLDSVRRRALMRDARAREVERQKRKDELDRLRAQEEEAARQAARTTHED